MEMEGQGVGRTSTKWGGLSSLGPWNHPLMDSLVLSSVRISSTWKIKKRGRSEKVRWRSSSYCTESFIIWKYTPGEMRQVWLQKTQNCFEQEQDFLLFHLVLHCLKSKWCIFFAKAQYTCMCSNISSPFCRDLLTQSFCKDTYTRYVYIPKDSKCYKLFQKI